ncbi:MAG: alcohol dehydrogenase [Caulobacteraceae bacterium]|nr:MAG: alcohol dehydrogenase [Caulobacteraceae bacterium]
MKGQAVTAFGKPLAEITVELPALKGSEALVRVTGCGVCHSDVHIHDGKFDMGKDAPAVELPVQLLPLIMGHEIEGVVEALGPDAAKQNPKVKVGDRVAVFPWIGCHACPACARGEQHLCANNRGLGTRIHGGYADYCHVPVAEALIPCGNLPPGAGGVAMCSGLTGYSAFRKLDGIEKGAAILLVGLGGVGLSGLAAAVALHDGPIIAADVSEGARKAALERGATEAVDPSDPKALEALVARGDVAGAIDFVGAPATLGFAIGAIRRGGKVFVVGLYGGAIPLPIPSLPFKAMVLGGSYVGSLDEARDLMAYMREGKIAPPMMRERPLAEANDALNDLRGGKVVGRMVLTP